MTSCEWVLGVQMKHVENPYNVEIRDDLYCCCDNPDVNCSRNITDEDRKCINPKPADSCEPYFLIYITDCSHDKTCFVPKTDQFRIDNSSALYQLILTIPLMAMEASNKVRIKSYKIDNQRVI